MQQILIFSENFKKKKWEIITNLINMYKYDKLLLIII
jgi:hypothetical protein